VTRGLYERDEELARAEEAVSGVLRRFESGGTELGELLLFAGRPGTGKTSLLGEVRRLVAQEGGTVLFARGGEQEQTVPFRVLRQLLMPQLAKLSADERKELFGNWYEVAAPAVGVAPAPSGQPSDPQGVLDGLDWVVTQFAVRNAPLTLIVDDLHWADPESLNWLASFLLRIRELPALVVLGYRVEELRARGEETAAIRAVIDGTGGHHPRVATLRELSPDAVAGLVRRELGQHADDAFCREVWAVTAGNPYETVELLAKVRDHKMPPVEDSAVRLRELVASGKGQALIRRLEKFGPATFRFVWAAAILGTDIDPELCANIAALGPADAARAIDQLREERILTGSHRLDFVHPTIATTVYQAIPSAARTGMHGVAAQAVLDAGLGVSAASRHLLEVHADDDLNVVRQLREAAAEHLAVGAPDAARRCLERALKEPPAPEDRAYVLYELGCATLLTNPPVTVNHLRAALGASPGLNREKRVYATMRLASALAHCGRLTEAATVVAEEAERAAPGPDRMRLRVGHAMWRVFSGAEDDALERSRRLSELASGATGQDSWERAVLVLHAWDLTLRGEHTTEIVRRLEGALVNGAPGPGIEWTNDFWGFEIPTLIGLCALYSDRLDIASELFNTAAAEYEVLGWSGAHLAFATVMQGAVARRWGQLRLAEELLWDGLRKSERLGRGLPLQWDALGMLIDTLLARGREKEAIELAGEYRFGPPFPASMVVPDAPTLHGRLLFHRGKTREAAEALTAAGAQLDRRGQQNPVWAPWPGLLARCLKRQEPERAQELAAEQLKRAERFGTRSAVGMALRTCAAVTDGPEAVVLLEQAVESLGQSPAGYEYALALVDQGSALRRTGRPQQAADPLYMGLELAAQCGADGLAQRARRELAACGHDSLRRRPVRGAPLTELEREVAAFSAEGLPPARIAERLELRVHEVAQLLAAAHRKTGVGPSGLSKALAGVGPEGEPDESESEADGDADAAAADAADAEDVSRADAGER